MFKFPINDVNNNAKIDAEISFDLYGNLYFSFDDQVFQITVNKINMPIGETGDYSIIDDEHPKLNKFKLLDEETSLKAKVKKHKEIIEHGSDEEYDSDGEIIDNTDYYEEDKFVIDENDDDNNSDSEKENEVIVYENKLYNFGNDNYKFHFSSIGSFDFKINNRLNGDISSLYDTYIYDNDNHLCFKTNGQNNEVMYRLKLFQNGNCVFRSIGCANINYKISYYRDQNRLEFIRIW